MDIVPLGGLLSLLTAVVLDHQQSRTHAQLRDEAFWRLVRGIPVNERPYELRAAFDLLKASLGDSSLYAFARDKLLSILYCWGLTYEGMPKEVRSQTLCYLDDERPFLEPPAGLVHPIAALLPWLGRELLRDVGPFYTWESALPKLHPGIWRDVPVPYEPEQGNELGIVIARNLKKVLNTPGLHDFDLDPLDWNAFWEAAMELKAAPQPKGERPPILAIWTDKGSVRRILTNSQLDDALRDLGLDAQVMALISIPRLALCYEDGRGKTLAVKTYTDFFGVPFGRDTVTSTHDVAGGELGKRRIDETMDEIRQSPYEREEPFSGRLVRPPEVALGPAKGLLESNVLELVPRK